MADPATRDRPRRFYAEAAAAPVDGGHGVLLDGRPPRSPAGARLVVPTLRLADLLAQEWAAQGAQIDAMAMGANRLAFTAIDRTPGARAEVAGEVARYAGSDLLCHRADFPRALAEREAAAWDPWLAWADAALGVRLVSAQGLSTARQPPEAMARVEQAAAALDDFALTGLAFAAALYGSAVLALAVGKGALDAAEAFELSRLDEAFQEAAWGVDAEAAARTQALRAEAVMIGRWFAALRG